MRFFLILSFLGLLIQSGYSQSIAGVNPFEITNRLPKQAAGGLSTGPVNPFDVVAHRVPGVSKTLLVETAAPGSSSVRLLRFPEGNTVSPAFIFGFLIVNLFFFTCSGGHREY